MALTSEDKLAIMELVARYNHAYDGGDAEAWAATFTEDGAFQSRGRRTEGREALVRKVEEEAEKIATFKPRHLISNFVIEGDGDSATLTCHLLLMSGSDVAAVGSYDDVLRRVDGVWKFAHRTVTVDSRA